MVVAIRGLGSRSPGNPNVAKHIQQVVNIQLSGGCELMLSLQNTVQSVAVLPRLVDLRHIHVLRDGPPVVFRVVRARRKHDWWLFDLPIGDLPE